MPNTEAPREVDGTSLTRKATMSTSRRSMTPGTPGTPSPSGTKRTSVLLSRESSTRTSGTASPDRRAVASAGSRSPAAAASPSPSTTLQRRATSTSTVRKTTTASPTPSTTLQRRATMTSRASATPTVSSSLQRRATTTTSTTARQPASPVPSMSRRQTIQPASSTSVRPSPSQSKQTVAAVKAQIEKDMADYTEKIAAAEQSISENAEAMAAVERDLEATMQLYHDAQSQQEEQLLEAILSLTDQLKVHEQERDSTLEQIEQLQEQADRHAQWMQEMEIHEQTLRNDMDGLRDELEADKDELRRQIKAKAKEQKSLEASSSSLREEIQYMHKSHQSRLTAVTNQLRTKHGDEINALLDAFDKELQAKQDGSEASAQLDAKRKHMIECERLLQERTRELQDAKERHERELQEVHAANAQALKDAEQANQDEMERQLAELKDRLDQLVADHETDMEKKHVHHQADMATLRSWSLAPEARAQMLADIEASIGQEGLQYVAQLKHEHATKLADIEAQVKEHQTRLDNIKAQHSELLNSHKDEQAAAYEDRKAATFNELAASFQSKYDALADELRAKFALQRDTTQQRQDQGYDAVVAQYDADVAALTRDLDAKLKERQSAAASAVRASTGQQLRADFEIETEKLAQEHRDALEALQARHHDAYRQLEAKLQEIKHQHTKTNGHLTAAHEATVAKAAADAADTNQLDQIRVQIQTSLKDQQANTVNDAIRDHEARMNQTKREHVLQRDRQLETITAEFDASVANLMASHRNAMDKLRTAHSERTKQIHNDAVAARTQMLQPLMEEHAREKKIMEETYQEQIKALEVAFAEHDATLTELRQIASNHREHRAAVTDTLTEERENAQNLFDTHHTSTFDTLRASYRRQTDDLMAAHDKAMIDAQTRHQQELVAHGFEGTLTDDQQEIKDSLIANYERQLADVTQRHLDAVTPLEARAQDLEAKVASLRKEHTAKDEAARREWQLRLDDATRALESLSRDTLEDSIRSHMDAAAQQSRDKLIVAHKSTLRSMAITHEQQQTRMENDYAAALAKLEKQKTQLEAHEQTLKAEIERLSQGLRELEVSSSDAKAVTMRAEWEVREAEHKTEIQRLRDASQALQDQLTVLDQQRDDVRASLDRRQHDHDLAAQSDDLIARDKQQLQQKSELLRAKDVELKNLEDRKLKLEQAHKKKHAAQRVQLETTVHAQVKSHQEEIERTHRHFQRLLDIKDDEMSNLSYRLKTVTATRQKDINKLQVKQHQKQQSLQEYRQRLMQSLENQTKAYQAVETKHQGLETKYLHGQRQWKQLQQERKQIQDQLLSFQRNNLQLVESIQQLQTDVRSTKV